MHRTGKYSYNAICDVCGFQFKSGQLQKRWDGFMVCREDWEPRNILDFYRPRNDAHPLPWTRPEVDVFIELACTIFTAQGRADIGTSDCAKADASL